MATLCVAGLPQSGSWQDLKDHMREAGDVCYADVYRDGTGVVEFVRKEDMSYAVRKLDNTKFRSHEVCRPARLVMDFVVFAVPRVSTAGKRYMFDTQRGSLGRGLSAPLAARSVASSMSSSLVSARERPLTFV